MGTGRPRGNPAWQRGVSGNPNGRSKEEAAQQHRVREALSTPEVFRRWYKAYTELLDEKHPLIVKDFMDRFAGKPLEKVELSGNPDAPLFPPMAPRDITVMMGNLDAFIKLKREELACKQLSALESGETVTVTAPSPTPPTGESTGLAPFGSETSEKTSSEN